MFCGINIVVILILEHFIFGVPIAIRVDEMSFHLDGWIYFDLAYLKACMRRIME